MTIQTPKLPIVVVALSLTTQFLTAANYWIARDGDDRAAGTSRKTAWASPSRGQPSRVREGHKAGDKKLPVYSTHGFLPAGKVAVGGQALSYSAKTENVFILEAPFDRAIAPLEFVYDADILDGDSFEPGDVINFAGGDYVNNPLNFCQSGSKGKPIIYQAISGERPVLISEVFNLAPIKRLGSWRKDLTKYVVLKDIAVFNQAEGNHGAGGIELYGVNNLVIDGCDVDVSGRDVNGDNDGIKLFGATDVIVKNCRIRSRQANGVMAWQSSRIHVVDSIVFESFNGIQVSGGRFPASMTVDHCTIYAINTFGAINAESPGTMAVTNCIIVESPSTVTPAMRGNGNGDYNDLWHTAEKYGKGWNGKVVGMRGKHDIHADPLFISRNPDNPYFLRIPHNSPAARAGRDRTYMGAFPPISRPMSPKPAEYNVQDFGAVGDGVTDDLPAIDAALSKAAEVGAGKIIFPPTNKAYLVSDTIYVRSDYIHLYGPGATIKLKANAGRMDVITVGEHIPGLGAGAVKRVIEHVKIEGLVIDGSYRSQPQQRKGNNPRGLWSGNAHHVMLKNLTFRDTFCGVTFGPGSRNCDTIDVTVTNWDHDAFGASGRGLDGGCTDIRFIRCKAVNTLKCVKGWEVEEGAARIYLEDCLIENIGGTGTGFYVRHHEYKWPLHVDDVTFVRCVARKLTGQGFIVTTTPGTILRSVKPNLRTRNIRLINCKTDARVTIACGVENVVIQGGWYGNLVAVGFEDREPSERDARLPVRSVMIRNAEIRRIKINARTGNANAELGDKYFPDYEPSVRLNNVSLGEPPDITGKRKNVTIVENLKKNMMKAQRNDALIIVANGKPLSTIVIADDADWWQRMAAGWLQEYVEKATGAKLPMMRENDSPDGTLISVGHTKLAHDAGILTDGLKWDGCRLQVKHDVIFLLGRDGKGVGRGDPSPKEIKDFYEGDPWRADRIHGAMKSDLAGANGTCKAVVTFLEDVCGIRWFMPFEQGIVIPETRELSVSRSFKKLVTPPFAYAMGSFLYGTPRLYPSAYANNIRCGIRLKTFGGHSWYHWVNAGYFKEHPEYFALRDGKRTAVGNHLCTSNLDVQKLLLEGIRGEFDKGYEWVQIGQSDGWKPCECKKCEAMDNFKPWDKNVDGPDWKKWLHTTNRDNPVERIHVVHDWVAEQVAISHPGKKVHYLAYIPTRWPSKKIEKYSPNVVAELCHDIPEMMDAWADKVSSMTSYKIWWDMSWVYGHAPDITPKEVADEIRNLRDHGVIGLFNGGDGHNWGLNGPVYFTLGKLLGNPDFDEDELVREYCRGVYGEAGEAMFEFFHCLYGPIKGSSRPLRQNKLAPDSPHSQDLRARFPPSVTHQLEKLITRAEAIGVTGSAADNLRMTRIQLDYLRLVTNMWSMYEAYQIAGTRESLIELKKHVDAFEDFRHMVLHMDPDDAKRRFPDWGQLCKWLIGASYWHSWYYLKDRADLTNIRGTPVGYYAKIREPLTLDFDSLMKEIDH